jgi:hypothetical protein
VRKERDTWPEADSRMTMNATRLAADSSPRPPAEGQLGRGAAVDAEGWWSSRSTGGGRWEGTTDWVNGEGWW